MAMQVIVVVTPMPSLQIIRLAGINMLAGLKQERECIWKFKSLLALDCILLLSGHVWFDLVHTGTNEINSSFEFFK